MTLKRTLFVLVVALAHMFTAFCVDVSALGAAMQGFDSGPAASPRSSP